MTGQEKVDLLIQVTV